MTSASCICNFVKYQILRPVWVLAAILFLSVFSLAAAYTAEFWFGLAPCILCLFQRIPFALVTLISLIGLAFRKKAIVVNGALALSGLAFLTNSAIAFYHTGVEQKWWRSFIEGCAVPPLETETSSSLLSQIMKAPAVSCDVIPWQDPILGLSMANYNVLMCFGLGVLCFLTLFLKQTTCSPHN